MASAIKKKSSERMPFDTVLITIALSFARRRSESVGAMEVTRRRVGDGKGAEAKRKEKEGQMRSRQRRLKERKTLFGSR